MSAMTTPDVGTHQHQCPCGNWEECSDLGNGDACTQPGAGWINRRFYCKDCAEDKY